MDWHKRLEAERLYAAEHGSDRKYLRKPRIIKMKPTHFIIRLVAYPYDIMVSVDETDESLLKTLMSYGNSKKDCKQIMGFCDSKELGRYCMLPSAHSVIRIKTQEDKFKTMGIVVHEVFHAVTFILNRMGLQLKLYTSDEAYSYLMEYVSTEIFKKLKLS